MRDTCHPATTRAINLSRGNTPHNTYNTMKRFIAIAALLLSTAPAQAGVARAYNGNMYSRCNFVGSSVFCKHNDAARAEDAWHAKKNACVARVSAEAINRYGDDGYGNGVGVLDKGTAANAWYMSAMNPCFAK